MVWRRLGWVVGAFHIGTILLFNVVGYHMSLSVVAPQGIPQQSRFIDRLRSLGHTAPIVHYARFTGIATGYGFYSPHVASPYVIEVVACTGGPQPCDTLVRPGWARGAGAVRYRAFTASLRNLLPAEQRLYDTDTIAIRYTRVLARQAALHIAEAYGAQAYRWRAYVIHLPTLRARRSITATPLIDESLAASRITTR